MIERIAEKSPRFKARISGVVYLLYFLTAILGVLLLKGMVVDGDAAATANHILAHERLYRLGIAIGLVGTAFYVALAALFYELFKPVNRALSLVAAFLCLVGCASSAFGSLFQFVPLVVLGDNQYLSVFNLEQLQALALLFLKVNDQTGNVCLVFFGLYCILLGYLIFRSTFLPKILGVLMALAGVAWLAFISPSLANHLGLYIQILGILAEGALMLWLLIMGVNDQRWKEQAGIA